MVHLSVNREDKIYGVHLLSGDAGSILGQISLDAVSNAQLPAMPPLAVEELAGKRLPIDLTFEYLPPLDTERKASSH